MARAASGEGVLSSSGPLLLLLPLHAARLIHFPHTLEPHTQVHRMLALARRRGGAAAAKLCDVGTERCCWCDGRIGCGSVGILPRVWWWILVWRRGPPPSMVRISENFLQSIETCDTEETRLATLCLLFLLCKSVYTLGISCNDVPCGSGTVESVE